MNKTYLSPHKTSLPQLLSFATLALTILSSAWLTMVGAKAQNAEVATPNKAAENREASFPALDEYEKRSNILQVREKMLFEINVRGERQKKVEQMFQALQGARQEKDGDQQLLQLIQLRRQVLECLDELTDANVRQVELAALLDNATAAGGLLPQVATYLQDMRRQLLDMGNHQKTTDKHLRQMLQNIKTSIQNVPPPARFTNKTGLEMRLVRFGQEMFYISDLIPKASFKTLQALATSGQSGTTAPSADATAPPAAPTDVAIDTGEKADLLTEASPSNDVSLFEAVNFARWLSEQEACNYRLPEVAELAILNRNNLELPAAIWTITPWRPTENLEYGRMCDRFGVKLYHVWDPKRLFTESAAFFGELPQARYPQLGFIVITPARTGWQERWMRINAML